MNYKFEPDRNSDDDLTGTAILFLAVGALIVAILVWAAVYAKV
jgi:hypothetical protein